MKKTLNITIGGRVFAIEEDAYEKLNNYLEAVKKTFASYPDPQEIIADMEDRLAEQFQTMHEKDGVQFITLQNVETVIAIMGTPEDIEHETDKEESSSTKDETRFEAPRRLYRNSDDKIIFGVCSGLAAYFGLDAVWIRIGFIILTLLWGSGIIVYIILASF
jgi:phage shock protein PspC (stress-responsive transcriptional regulator)